MSKSNIHIIVEIGSTHGGNIADAHKLISLANETGADSIKAQFLFSDGLYQRWLRIDGPDGQPDPYVEALLYHYKHDMGLQPVQPIDGIVENAMMPHYRDAEELNEEQWRELAATAQKEGISFSASVFCERGLKLLDSLNPPYIKIASCDLNNHRFLRAALATGRQVIVSTGMSTLGDIDRSVNVMAKAGWGDKPPVLLHCVAAYPHGAEAANMQMVRKLRGTFDLPVGYSDHTEGNECALLALAQGATWFEKHMTHDIDRTIPGSVPGGLDHPHSRTPAQMKTYVDALRFGELALSVPADKVGAKERKIALRARRGLWVNKGLSAGTVITEALFTNTTDANGVPQNDAALRVLRCEADINADKIDDIMGRTLVCDVLAGSPLRHQDLTAKDPRVDLRRIVGMPPLAPGMS